MKFSQRQLSRAEGLALNRISEDTFSSLLPYMQLLTSIVVEQHVTAIPQV
jgi:hypothetical protein